MTPAQSVLDVRSGASDNGVMTVNTLRLPFSLDPLMAEAKRRMRQRRLLVAALVVALAAAAAGTTLTLRGPSTPSRAGTSGSFSNLALHYPANWKVVGWSCWIGPLPNMLLLTTASPTPVCRDGSFPPRQRLGSDGVAVWFLYPAPPLNVRVVSQPSTRIGGQPARFVAPPLQGLGGSKWVTCTGGAGPGHPLGARIEEPGLSGRGAGVLSVGAVVCGPDYGRGEAAVRRMVVDIRFER
jgi:hypothetical protein